MTSPIPSILLDDMIPPEMAVSANLEPLSKRLEPTFFIPERILSPTFFPLVFFDSTCEYKRDDKDINGSL